MQCWCGGIVEEFLREDYGRCADCGTLIYRRQIDFSEHSTGDGEAFYGDRYWCHQVPEVHGLPGLEERARSDLPERATYHLAKVLEHLAPGGRVLELGCGAGSLTYLLREAGFSAEGLELGPTAIEHARRHFGLVVHRGPLESQGELGLWNAIVAVDVLEHLPDPLGTLRLCARQLAAGGLLFLQTPCYRQEGAEWSMFLPEEHLHLFTEMSIESLLHLAGFATVEVGTSLFAHDMWVVAAVKGPLERRLEPFKDLPPMVVALLDAYTETNRIREERDAVDEDRRFKQADVDRLLGEMASVRIDQKGKADLLQRQDEELRRVREDQGQKQQLLERLETELTSVRTDQTCKQELIERLETELEAVRSDQQAKEDLIVELDAERAAIRGDQARKQRLIERLSSELAEVRADYSTLSSELAEVREDQLAKEAALMRLGTELESARADQGAKQDLIERLSLELGEVRADQQAKETVIHQLEQARAAAVAELDAIHKDRRFRWLKAMGVRLGGVHLGGDR